MAMPQFDHSTASLQQLAETASTSESILTGLQDAGACIQGVYVHVPFCMHRCHYCDFFTVAGRDQWRSAYVTRLLDEAAVVAQHWPGPADTLFVGGGTPTWLEPPDLARLLEGLAACSLLAKGGEWTVEANPETVTEEVAGILAGAGVNRVSLGAQSFRTDALKALERWHDPDSVPRALGFLRDAGIQDCSLDLIFAVPDGGDALSGWASDLKRAVSLAPTHLSCYGLTYEPGTPLRRRLESGAVTQVDQDIEAVLYATTQSVLADHGYTQYEISNWAQGDQVCNHNLNYWRNANWWPLGPSGSGHVNGTRWRNRPRLGPYLEGQGLPEIDTVEVLDADGRAGEVLMLGLRCTRGIERQKVIAATSLPMRGQQRAAAIERHLESGLLVWDDDLLRLTQAGMLLGDTVLVDLL